MGLENVVPALGSHVRSNGVSDTEEEGENRYWGTSGRCSHVDKSNFVKSDRKPALLSRNYQAGYLK